MRYGIATGCRNGLFGEAPHPYGAALMGVRRRFASSSKGAKPKNPEGESGSRA
jgi:hypothetical protein